MTAIETIAATLLSVAMPGMKHRDLMAAVRKKHPEASTKEIVRAAFYAITAGQGSDEKALQLHDFALGERAVEDDDAPAPKRNKRKRSQEVSAGDCY